MKQHSHGGATSSSRCCVDHLFDSSFVSTWQVLLQLVDSLGNMGQVGQAAGKGILQELTSPILYSKQVTFSKCASSQWLLLA